MSNDINFSCLDNSFGQVNSVSIGVISDTHISDKGQHLPGIVLDAFKHLDLIIHAGDMVSLG